MAEKDSGSIALITEKNQPDLCPEKEALIMKVIELQSTLQDLSQRVNTVKEENSRLKTENQVLNQYIDNLMHTSGIFKSIKEDKRS